MHFSLHQFAAIAAVVAWTTTTVAQGPKFITSAALGTPSSLASQALSSAQNPSSRDEENLTNPLADPRAIVLFGHARFTVLTPELIRMEWAADEKFEDHASLVFLNRRLPVPRFTHEASSNNSKLILTTDALKVVYTPKAEGRFSATDLSITLTVNGKPITWQPGAIDPLNLKGTTRTLDGALGDKTKEPIGNGFVSRTGWAVEDDSTRPLFDSADFRFTQGMNSPWPWVMERPAGDRQDWYFFGYGHKYKKALGDYVRVAGRIPLPPRFAFGAWWSRYWAYSDQEIEEIIRGFRENSTPLDVFVIDMDWHTNREQLAAAGEKDQAGQSLGWTGYSWNKLLFPDPTQFLNHLHADGLKTSLNMHPASGVQPWEDAYPAMAKVMGIDPATKKYVPFDITDKKYATNYMNLLHHPLEKQGIDFWWLDWQQEPTTKLPNVNPTWWLNYVHFTDQQREGKRPLLFHRWGGLGNHRYQIGFSGDTVSVWDSLAFQPWFTATAANVGYAYWSHDIGGHMPGAVDPELYTRWVQFGVFSPILRTHTTKNPDSERRIWAYPEPFAETLRSAFQLRYAMQPYIYTEARKTYDTGVAFLRPLYYDWPEADEAYTSKNEYLFGDQMLVAPVVSPADKTSGLANQHIWLPEGDWIESTSAKHFTGPTSVDRGFSIEQTPVYVRAGAIVPMQPPMLYTGQKPVDPLIVNVWPLKTGTSSSYAVYEDSGVAEEYQRGVFARTPIKASQTGDTLRVEIGPIEGSYPGMLKSRGYEIRLPADWPPASVSVNGSSLDQTSTGRKPGWSFEGNTLTTIIPVQTSSVESRVIIDIRRAPGLTARRDDLDGFAGSMTRLRGAYDALQKTWPVATPPDSLIDAMQSGDRLSYHPENAKAEIEHYRMTVIDAEQAVDRLQQDFAHRVDEYTKRMSQDALRNMDLDAQKKNRIESMTRALKLAQAANR